MTSTQYSSTITAQDNRRVVLLKSLATNNRFYALVDPASGLKNADTVDRFPDDLHFGVAYPCLEDGLNDFAVIRTAFETLEYFPDDEAMREELMTIIAEARQKLTLRLTELRDRIGNRTAHFLGTDLAEFRAYVLDMAHKGYPRRNLDSMMKLNVFSSVAAHEPSSNGPEPMYYYEFRDPSVLVAAENMTARQFVSMMFDDILHAVQDDRSYVSRHVFERDAFQKFIALMFINYATTDPVFYGTHKEDYAVSADRDMDDTPLYRAIANELRQIEERYRQRLPEAPEAPVIAVEHPPAVQLPDIFANEEAILGPLSSICSVARRLERLNHADATELARVIMANVAILVGELKNRQLISEAAYDPTSNGLTTWEWHHQTHQAPP